MERNHYFTSPKDVWRKLPNGCYAASGYEGKK